MKPLISVIVPIFMVEQYLDKCIESVVNQTYDNLEIILVDDGSPDSCPKICDNWAERDDRIKVIHKQNEGVSIARNTAFDMCTGEYITFVDADDWVESRFVEELVSAVETGADIVSAGLTLDYLDEESDIINCEEKLVTDKQVMIDFLLDKIRPEACTKLYKKSTISNIRFNEKRKYSEDLLFNYYAFKQSSKVACVNNTMYHYLQESGNSSTTPLMTENRKNSYKVFEEILEDCKADKELYSYALYQYTMRVFAIVTRVIKHEEYSRLYYDELVDSILQYKKDIVFCSTVKKKYKLSAFMIGVSKGLFKIFVQMMIK